MGMGLTCVSIHGNLLEEELDERVDHLGGSLLSSRADDRRARRAVRRAVAERGCCPLLYGCDWPLECLSSIDDNKAALSGIDSSL